ncbi:MAG: general secretion pathway protein GspB [Arenicella sp.]|nr:general secretion pathway protein GspB [Arenicella sp.]
MSTILDALKKSEQERKLKNVPTLADMPAPEEPTRWPVYVGVVLAALFLISLVLLLARQSADPLPQATAPIEVSNETVAAPATVDTDSAVVVNVVSYSKQPEQRFVMINGKMFRENEFVRPGLKVIEITEQSVVLNERGRRLVKQP